MKNSYYICSAVLGLQTYYESVFRIVLDRESDSFQ